MATVVTKPKAKPINPGAYKPITILPRPGHKSFEILCAVADQWRVNDFGPTVEELRQAVGLTSRAGVQFHISNLLDLGLLENIANRRRTLRPTGRGMGLIGIFAEK